MLSVNRPSEIERLILNGELDAGVLASQETPPGLNVHPLYKERSNLYCSEHHVLFHRPDPDVQLGQDWMLDLVEDPYTNSLPMADLFHRAARADSLEGVALLVKSGDYVGFLPDHYVAMLAGTTRLRLLRPDLFSDEQRIDLVWRAGPVNVFVKGLFAELQIDHLRSRTV